MTMCRIAPASPPDNVAATPPPPARIVPGASVQSLLPTSCRRKKPEPVRASHVALLCHGTTVYLGRSDKESVRPVGCEQQCPPSRTLGGARLTRTRDTLPGFDARSGMVESYLQVFGGVIVCACCAQVAPHLAGSSLSIPFADRMSSRGPGELRQCLDSGIARTT